MRKSVRVMAVALSLLMVMFVLASCGKTLSGKYSAEIAGTGAVLEFKGSKVTITVKALGADLASVEGKYSIKDDKITFEFKGKSDDENKQVEKYNGTFDFEEGEDYIKVGALGKFTKQK